ncbi:hypothetical protein R6Q57_000080 [Mikania cordata]
MMGTADEIVKAPEKDPIFMEDLTEEEQVVAVGHSAGLFNLGNTCYTNSTMQCLHSVPELKAALFEYFQSGRSNDLDHSSHPVIVATWDLFNEVDKNAKLVAPMQFWMVHFLLNFQDTITLLVLVSLKVSNCYNANINYKILFIKSLRNHSDVYHQILVFDNFSLKSQTNFFPLHVIEQTFAALVATRDCELCHMHRAAGEITKLLERKHQLAAKVRRLTDELTWVRELTARLDVIDARAAAAARARAAAAEARAAAAEARAAAAEARAAAAGARVAAAAATTEAIVKAAMGTVVEPKATAAVKARVAVAEVKAAAAKGMAAATEVKAAAAEGRAAIAEARATIAEARTAAEEANAIAAEARAAAAEAIVEAASCVRMTMCYCGRLATVRTSWTDQNPERRSTLALMR